MKSFILAVRSGEKLHEEGIYIAASCTQNGRGVTISMTGLLDTPGARTW
jgi:hypothetical protein